MRAGITQLEKYEAQKRKTNSELELKALVKQYAIVLSFFQKWETRGVRSVGELTRELRADHLSRESDKLEWLREQIESRVIGLDWQQFKTNWCEPESIPRPLHRASL